MSCCNHLLAQEEYNLMLQIDIENIQVLNATFSNIFRPFHHRFEQEPFIESDADEQIIIVIPFNSNIKLKSISVLGPGGDCNPSGMKAFVNRSIDFDNVQDIVPTQEWQLENPARDSCPEYPTRVAKFQNIRQLALFFDSNFGADTTKLTYIGLKGEWSPVNKDPIITNYELQANPSDHKTNADVTNNQMIQ